ncbi:MAG TPA: hypothetical protein VFB62_25240 [Polyangiaceae bacterium]|nr:hypothetical protein [Polyangiaceae bacterium]
MIRVIVLLGGACIGCTSIAGLDRDYALGEQTSNISASVGGGVTSASSSSSSANASSGTGAASEGGAPSMRWVVVDTLTVHCPGGDAVSSVTLNNGEKYKLRASGQCTCTGTTGCDAEWLDFNAPQTIAFSNDVDMGIGIDDPVFDLTRLPDWGAYMADHMYEADWTGIGAPITANFHDPDTSNNTGQLTLEILQLQ